MPAKDTPIMARSRTRVSIQFDVLGGTDVR
jgi:hypothetical protein